MKIVSTDDKANSYILSPEATMYTIVHFPIPLRIRRPADSGIALAVVLVVMTILTLFGIMLLVRTDSNLLSAHNEKEVAICRQAAEAATRQGMALSKSFYDSTSITYNTAILGCSSGSTCPPSPAQLRPIYIVDYPGKPFAVLGCPNGSACWRDRLFIGTAGVNNRSNVYVTIYARNNFDEPAAAGGGQVITDTDGRITIVGEAMMTFTGNAPLADRSNVRVRKMIAADILNPLLGEPPCPPGDPHGQHSNYGC